MSKRLPKLKSDKDVEKLLDGDLSAYLDADNLYRTTFEFAPKTKVINLRISPELLSAVKKVSDKRGIPYQRYIREALELSVKKSGAQT
jgi:predicted DNA binding CopG/RHH family protein